MQWSPTIDKPFPAPLCSVSKFKVDLSCRLLSTTPKQIDPGSKKDNAAPIVQFSFLYGSHELAIDFHFPFRTG